jgi:Skp family chaperone for outer membrane proteins
MKNERLVLLIFVSVALVTGTARAQQAGAGPAPQGQQSANTSDSTHLEQRLDQVLAMLNGMQHQLNDSKQQIDQLQSELQEVRAQLAAANGQTPAATAEAASQLQSSVQQLQNDNEILQAEVKQHDQTKVESASKYPVKINGLLLFSSFLNEGAVDNIDLPIVAVAKTGTTANGSLAATMRQTIVGLEARGPMIWGARSSGDFHVDFFGGVPYADYTTTTGNLRLRTAHTRLDWTNHSLIAALDAPLIAPEEPTSYVGVGEPPYAWSGKLWIWAPQIESMNHVRWGTGTLGFDFALMDPAAPQSPAISGERQPDPAERSRQPGYESRVSYSFPVADRTFTVGAGGYYSRQTYLNQQHVDAWAGTTDWRFPFTRRLELSGEFYRGRALGGLGGGTFKDYVTDPDSGAIRGLGDEGGWSQLKARITQSLEANAGFGEDAGFSGMLRYYTDPTATNTYVNLARNRTVIANIVFRPKTYLVFSAEYRNIYSWPISGQANTAQSLGLATGYSF